MELYTMERWYVVTTLPRREGEVHTALGLLPGVVSYYPRIRLHEVDGGLVRPLFPRYLFARFEMDVFTWLDVLETRGVVRVLGPEGEPPTPVLVGAVERIIEEVGADGVLSLARKDPRKMFTEGDLLTLVGGPFEGKSGICTRVDGGGVRINLSPLLGLGLGLYVPFKWVKIAEVQEDSSETLADYLLDHRAEKRAFDTVIEGPERVFQSSSKSWLQSKWLHGGSKWRKFYRAGAQNRTSVDRRIRVWRPGD